MTGAAQSLKATSAVFATHSKAGWLRFTALCGAHRKRHYGAVAWLQHHTRRAPLCVDRGFSKWRQRLMQACLPPPPTPHTHTESACVPPHGVLCVQCVCLSHAFLFWYKFRQAWSFVGEAGVRVFLKSSPFLHARRLFRLWSVGARRQRGTLVR